MTLPKLRVAGFDPTAPGVNAFPDNGMVRFELVAVEATVTLPLTLPADAGVNVTVKVALCPAVSVAGALIPLKTKPVPLIPTCEIVTLEAPVLVNVSERDWVLPTVTLPKLRLLGLDPKAPGATPAPAKGIVIVGLAAFEVMVIVPLALPADTGVNVALKVALCPAASVTGAVIPLRLKPVPLVAI